MTESEVEQLKAKLSAAEEVIKFYAENWQANGEGDPSTPGLWRSWTEPNDAMWDDCGRKAQMYLNPKAFEDEPK